MSARVDINCLFVPFLKLTNGRKRQRVILNLVSNIFRSFWFWFFAAFQKKSEKTIFYKATLCLAVTYKPPQKPRKQTSPPGVSKLQKKNAKKEGKKKKNQLSLFRRSSRNGGLSFREVLVLNSLLHSLGLLITVCRILVPEVTQRGVERRVQASRLTNAQDSTDKGWNWFLWMNCCTLPCTTYEWTNWWVTRVSICLWK